MLDYVNDVSIEGAARRTPNKIEQTVEVAVFLFLIVPSMTLSLFAVRQGNLQFPLVASATILRDLALVSLVWFFLWRNGEPVKRIGWSWRHGGKELIWGGVLFVPFFVTASLVEWAMLRLGLSAPGTSLPSFLRERALPEALLAVLLVSVVAVTEETIFRGYLLLRFRTILQSTKAAVVLSSLIFALGHGYEGSAGLVTVGAMGVMFAAVYLWRGSLIAPMVMHFLQDFLGIVLIPLLGLK